MTRNRDAFETTAAGRLPLGGERGHRRLAGNEILHGITPERMTILLRCLIGAINSARLVSRSIG